MSADPYSMALKMAIPSLVKAGSSLFRKTPQKGISSDTTNALNRFRQISKEGLYGQDVKNDIFTDIKQSSKETDNKIRSQAVKQGIENSGIVADQLIKKDGVTTLALAKIAKKIHQENEQSKIDATRVASDIGQGIENTKYQNALARYDKTSDTINAFADAGTSYLTGKKEERRDAEFDEMFDNPDFIKALAQIF